MTQRGATECPFASQLGEKGLTWGYNMLCCLEVVSYTNLWQSLTFTYCHEICDSDYIAN